MIVPTYIMGYVGTPARLTCLAGGNISWYFQTTSSSPISRKPVILFHYLDFEHKGIYFCHGLYDKDGDKHFLAKAIVDVELFLISGVPDIYNSIMHFMVSTAFQMFWSQSL